MIKKTTIAFGAIALLTGAYVGAQSYVSNIAEKRIQTTIADISNVAEIKYGKVNANPLTGSVKVSDILVVSKKTNQETKIKDIVVYDVDADSKIPSHLSIAFNGVAVDMDSLKLNPSTIKSLALANPLLLNIRLEYKYDTEKKELKVKTLSIHSDDIAGIDINLELGAGRLNAKNLGTALMSMQHILIHHVSLTYKDQSLLEKLMTLDAKKHHKSLATYKQDLAKATDKTFGDSPLSQSFVMAFKEIVKNSGGFTLTLSPPEPVSLGRIMQLNSGGNASNAVKELNIQLRYNKS